jgi:putative membrane protein insertion efficiency factor
MTDLRQPSSADHRPGAMSHAALGLIKAYQYGIRPMLGQRCRFFPSCSEYAADAIRQHGLLRGATLGARRLGKCHPWHPGGYDPVPAPHAQPIEPHTRAATPPPLSSNP